MRCSRKLIVQVMLAVMTAIAPSLYWGASSDRAMHDGAFVMCVNVDGQANEAGTGDSDNGVRQLHSHCCAGHALGVPDIGVRMHIVESRDSDLPEPTLGVPRIFTSRFDRPPLTPDLV